MQNSQVRLVWITPQAEAQIAYQARVSNPKNQNNKNFEKLIKYCAEHKHWSIFEMANMCVEIVTTRDIANQIVRHRSFSFQQFSLRYAEPEELNIPEIRLQDAKNRQSSIVLPDEPTYHKIKEWWEQSVVEIYGKILDLYDEGIKKGLAKECVRGILPLSTVTKLYMNGTIRSWIHYLQIRCSEETQLEHRMVATACKELFKENLPITYEALFS